MGTSPMGDIMSAEGRLGVDIFIEDTHVHFYFCLFVRLLQSSNAGQGRVLRLTCSVTSCYNSDGEIYSGVELTS